MSVPTINCDDLVTCPYNKFHQIRRSRIQYHILKCKKNYPDIELVVCPYNATHQFPEHEKRGHLLHCRDRRVLEMQRYSDPIAGRHGYLLNPPFYGSAELEAADYQVPNRSSSSPRRHGNPERIRWGSDHNDNVERSETSIRSIDSLESAYVGMPTLPPPMAGSNDPRLREMSQPANFRDVSDSASEFSFAPGATSSVISDAPPYRPPMSLRRPNPKGNDRVPPPPPPPPTRDGTPIKPRHPPGAAAIARRLSPTDSNRGPNKRSSFSDTQDSMTKWRTPRRRSIAGEDSDTETETDATPRTPKHLVKGRKPLPLNVDCNSDTQTECTMNGYESDVESRTSGVPRDLSSKKHAGDVDEEGLPIGLTLEMGRLVPRRKSNASQESHTPTPGGESDATSYFSYT